MPWKYGCASQSSVFVNRRCTSSPPYRPGGRLIEWTTTRSTCAPAGRGPQFGEASRRAKRYQPSSHSALAVSGVVMRVVAARGRDREPGDAVADLAQAEPQALRRGCVVEVALVLRTLLDLALLLVEPALQVAGQLARERRRGGRERAA